MKSGIAWSLRGLDDDAREAAAEAARQAGLSVNEWLNQAIAQRAADEGISSRDDEDDGQLKAVADSVAKLTRRIRAMDQNSRSAIAGLRDRLDEIDGNLGRVDRAGLRDDSRARSLQGVSAMVDQLAREIDNADENARSTIEGLRARVGASERPRRDQRDPNDQISQVVRTLDQRIATMAERLKRPPPAADTSYKLDDLRSRLEGLLARGPEPSRPPPPDRATAALDATLRALERRIDDATSRVAPPVELKPETLPEHDERVRRMEESLAQITGRLAEPPPPPPRKVDDLSSAIAEIAARQKSLDERADTQAMRKDQKAIAEGIATLRSDVAGLIARVTAIGNADAEDQKAWFGLSRRIDALAAEMPVDRGILSGIRGELDALRAISEGGVREQPIIERLDDLARKVPDHSRLDALGEEISAVRRALESADGPRALSRLEMRVSELARGVDAALNSRQAVVDTTTASMAAGLAEIRHAIEELNADRVRLDATGETLAEIRRSIDELSTASREADPASAVINGLTGNLIDIRTAIDDLAAATRNDASRSGEYGAMIAGLAASLDEIRQAIDARDGPSHRAEDVIVERLEARLDQIATRIDGVLDLAAPADVVNGLHDRLEALVDRLDRMGTQPAPPPVALDEIKGEITAIRTEIAGREPVRVDRLEDQIRDLAGRLEVVARPDSDASHLADLEAQVARLATDLEKAMPRSAGFEQVEANLSRLQAHLSENRHESIEAARDAVRELAGSKPVDGELVRALRNDLDHIRAASGDTDHRTQATLTTLHGTLTSIVDRLTELEHAERQDLAATAAGENRRSEPVIARAEAASGPRILARRSELAAFTAPADTRAPASETARREPGEPGRDRAAGERRADFIAAARRAAQAAVAESGAAQQREERLPSARPSAFARIGQAIRSRKKPLLLAAAAIVLAIGAVQVFGPLLDEDESGVAVAKVEPPALVTPAEPEPLPLVAATPAPTVPKVAGTAMVPPTAISPVALAEPGTIAGSFGDGVETPAAAGVAPTEDATPIEAAAVAPALEKPGAAAEPAGDSVAAIPGSAIGSDKLRSAAAAGDPAAAFEIATRYAEGRGVTQNLATAAEWYERAAKGGVAVAQYRLASLYERGQGVKKDPNAAVNWYQRAADQGNVGAMHNLAVLMSEGVDGPPDPAKALEWFLAAGNYGVKDSQYNLGVIYARGLGLERDLIESYKWFAIAAAQGDTDAAARRDEVGGLLPPDQIARARAAVQAWRAKPPLPEANGVNAPDGGWDAADESITEADRAALVKKIQALLTDHGYDPGPADGVDGPKTRDAVRAFQRNLGVAETGQIDGTLVTALAEKN